MPVEKDAADLPKTTKPLAERKKHGLHGDHCRGREGAGGGHRHRDGDGDWPDCRDDPGNRGGNDPLQKKLKVFGQQLGLLVILICTGIFALGVLRGNNPFGMFMTAVTLAVAAVPEGLPAIVTIVLAGGTKDGRPECDYPAALRGGGIGRRHRDLYG